jgi:hypothetical protein
MCNTTFVKLGIRSSLFYVIKYLKINPYKIRNFNLFFSETVILLTINVLYFISFILVTMCVHYFLNQQSEY